MKKILTFFMVCMLCTGLYGNDIVSIRTEKTVEYHNHETYEIWYDTVNNNPLCAIWDVTAEDAILSSQNNHRKSWSFIKCGSAPNASTTYKNSGYDRGHIVSCESKDQSEESARNTFRGCNVCPQTHLLNAGTWKIWEEKERKLALKHGEITVIAGPLYSGNNKNFGVHTVPDSFFKIIVLDGEPYAVLIFTQENTVRDSSIKEIETLSDIIFDFK